VAYVISLDRGRVPVPAPGHAYTFRNAGSDLGCIVGTFTPGRFANCFRELAELIDTTGAAPDRDTWIGLYGPYDTTFYEA
jgi:hypothetical protein